MGKCRQEAIGRPSSWKGPVDTGISQSPGDSSPTRVPGPTVVQRHRAPPLLPPPSAPQHQSATRSHPECMCVRPLSLSFTAVLDPSSRHLLPLLFQSITISPLQRNTMKKEAPCLVLNLPLPTWSRTGTFFLLHLRVFNSLAYVNKVVPLVLR